MWREREREKEKERERDGTDKRNDRCLGTF